MSEENQKKLFGISAIICIILLTIAYFGDLAISNTLINYHSWVGTFCQTFGEFPVYLIFALCGQIAMTYAWRGDCEKLLAGPLFVGGLALSLWQSKQYVNEFLGYLYSIQTNLKNGTAIAMANSDSATGGYAGSTIIIVWLLFFAIFTLLVQWWLKNKTTKQLTRYMKIAILASLTVWFALEVNLTLKDLWGRYRPYELTSGNHEFTNWLTINGVNGHKSFPSGHTMAATLCIVFSWFVSNNKRKSFFIGGIVYGVVIAISRVIVGAHFFSDVTFSFFLTALIIFIMNGLCKKLIEDF